MAGVRVVPVMPEDWPRVGRVFGPRERNPDACWCQRFLRHDEPDNRSALRREIQQATIPVGLLAYRGDTTVGWTRVVPRATLPGVTGNRALARILDDDPDAWWVACFVVPREERGGGVALALLEAAVSWAAQHGASVLDGHPVDTGELARPPSPAAVFTGTLGMFQRAGFTEIGRTYRTRPIMRRNLHG